MNQLPKIAVIGAGYWGKNLIRVFHQLGVLYAVCDSQKEHLEEIQKEYKIPRVFSQWPEVIESAEIDAVAIATPAVTHYEIAKMSLLNGKDVFVEKPLALHWEQAEELKKIADQNQRILMVDHLLHYHPAIVKLKEIINQGVLGKLQYIYSNRLNIGKLRSEENILWSFAPHDVSVILSLAGRSPNRVTAEGGAYLQEGVHDTTITHLSFSDKLKAHICVSWLHPYKEQRLVVIGNYGMAVFDDVQKEEKLCVYPHKIEWIKQSPVAGKAEKKNIPIEAQEPLQQACLHFLDCLQTRQAPLTDAQESLEVLKVLEEAQKSLDRGKLNGE